MYFIYGVASTFGMLSQKLLCARQILRCIYSHGLHIGYAYADTVAVLQPAQLFDTSLRKAYRPICL